MKGTLPSNPHYGSNLSLVGTTNPSSPLPTVSENVVDSVVFLTLTHDIPLYYTHSGTTSTDTILRPHFDALKYSISRTK